MTPSLKFGRLSNDVISGSSLMKRTYAAKKLGEKYVQCKERDAKTWRPA